MTDRFIDDNYEIAEQMRKERPAMTAKADTNPLREALEPFAAYARNARSMPDNFVISAGSKMARRQLTIGDCRAAEAALASEPVAGTVREALAATMIRCSLATGHGDTFDSLLSEMEWQVNRLQNRAALSSPAPAGRDEIARIIAPGAFDWEVETTAHFNYQGARKSALEKADAILALGATVSPHGNRATVSAPLLNGLIQDAIDALHPDVADDTVETFERSQLRKKFSARLLATPPAPGAADRAAVIEECAANLAAWYPDNANTNAFCAAIRSMAAADLCAKIAPTLPRAQRGGE